MTNASLAEKAGLAAIYKSSQLPFDMSSWDIFQAQD